MAVTYEPIATTTLGSASATITFSSIPATYTDLKLILNTAGTGSFGDVFLRMNSDSTTMYSTLYVRTNNASTAAGWYNNDTKIRLTGDITLSTTIPATFIADIMSYARTSNIAKSVLHTAYLNQGTTTGYVLYGTSTWRSSTTAINTLTLVCNGTTFKIGTTATLYGIQAA